MDIEEQCGEPFTDKRDKIIVWTSVVGIVWKLFLMPFGNNAVACVFSVSSVFVLK